MAANYAKIKPNIWRKQLKGFSCKAKLLGIFLMTNDMQQMLGMYFIPLVHMSIGTGLDGGETEAALNELEDKGFCHYDEETMFVWVTDMARTQVADNPNAKQLKGVANELTRLCFDEECVFVEQFLTRYSKTFRLPKNIEELEYCR